MNDRKPDGVAQSELDAQVQLLRSRVEGDLEKPAVILVTSARQGDGKSLTAETLVRSFRRHGHRAAFLRLVQNGESSERFEVVDTDSDGTVRAAEFSPIGDDSTKPENLAALVEELRAQYDYTIVDGGAYLESPPTMTLCRLADGVLLTVRLGRAPHKDDKLMFEMMEHSRARIIGVVATVAHSAGTSRQSKPVIKVPSRSKKAASTSTSFAGMTASEPSRVLRPDH